MLVKLVYRLILDKGYKVMYTVSMVNETQKQENDMSEMNGTYKTGGGGFLDVWGYTSLNITLSNKYGDIITEWFDLTEQEAQAIIRRYQ